MHDDDFDRGLAQRLRAYESRLPDADAPEPSTLAGRRRFGWPVVGFGALAAVAAVLALAVILGGPRGDVGESSPAPAPSASAPAGTVAPSTPQSSSAGPSVTSTLPADPSAQPATSQLAWAEVGSFGESSGPAQVNTVVAWESSLIAVGVEYQAALPIVGPTPPHEGRIWASPDGATWEDVSPDGFENTELVHLLVDADGDLVLYGWTRGSGADPADDTPQPAAWESPDGRSWMPANTGLPDGLWPAEFAQGARGSVAVVLDPSASTSAVWWSSDARDWELVHELGEGAFTVGAGDEGFVVAGATGAESTPTAFASGDGRSWLEAPMPPGNAVDVAARGADWVALSRPAEIVVGEEAVAELWASADGLDWAIAGSLDLEARDAGGAECTEFPTALLSAGPWLVASTSVGYPCSEGGVVTQGTQSISDDGASWTVLPFGEASGEIGLGTRVADAAQIDRRLVLVGDEDGLATFWLGEPQ